MKIIIFGAAGDVGRRTVTEAIRRGHSVTAVVRRAAQATMLEPGTTAVVADISTQANPASLVHGHDLVISALRPRPGQEPLLSALTETVLGAAATAGARALIVGGAASLRLPGKATTVLTEPGFLPENVVPIAEACQAQYELILKETKTDWSYLCPPAMLGPGERTGQYRSGGDDLLVSQDGTSAISMEDFAVALLDEAEQAVHQRRRFTVAY